MDPVRKCTSLGIGLPAVLLMRREGGFAIGITKAYPDDIAVTWGGAARADAETAYDNAVQKMMADEAREAERLRSAGCNSPRNAYLNQERSFDADPDQTTGGIDRRADEQPKRRA
jgi:hypothetical protein